MEQGCAQSVCVAMFFSVALSTWDKLYDCFNVNKVTLKHGGKINQCLATVPYDKTEITDVLYISFVLYYPYFFNSLAAGRCGSILQERRLKRLITLGGLEIGIQHQIVNALELCTPPPPPKKKKNK